MLQSALPKAPRTLFCLPAIAPFLLLVSPSRAYLVRAANHNSSCFCRISSSRSSCSKLSRQIWYVVTTHVTDLTTGGLPRQPTTTTTNTTAPNTSHNIRVNAPIIGRAAWYRSDMMKNSLRFLQSSSASQMRRVGIPSPKSSFTLVRWATLGVGPVALHEEEADIPRRQDPQG